MHRNDATLTTSRVFATTPQAIFAAFADPLALARWWGPAGFHNAFEVFEFRPGGVWRFVMTGPDGTRYPNESRFAEIVPGQRVVVEHRSAPRFTLTIELLPVPEGTALTWTQAFDDAAVATAMRPIAEPANEQNLDRLSAVLSQARGAAS